MNVTLQSTSGNDNSCIFSSTIGTASTTADSPILTTQSHSSPSPSTIMTTGSLLQQLSNSSLLTPNINAATVASAMHRLLPNGPNSSLFTVEQLELIRRLRMTGISADAVLEAFNTLEKIETDFDANRIQSIALVALMGNQNSAKLFPNDSLPNVEMSHQMSTQPPQLLPQNVISTTSPNLLQQLTSQAFANPTTGVLPPISTSLVTSNNYLTENNNNSKESPALSPERCPLPFPSSTAAIPDVSQSFFGSYPSAIHSQPLNTSTSSTPSTSSSSVSRPIRSQRTPMKEITTLDDPAELEEFMQQGEEGCINDMKQFITQFSLRQTTVAMMTGVSQPYISKLLNGNHKELSLRCRKNIYSWYLNCRRHPEKLASFLQDPSTRLETNGDGELVPQRRERYVFRPILIKILESFFAETPFPDYNKRAEIASACNSALQMDKKGVGLMPKEVVSPQVVANWFANKRKEMRRRSNEDPMPPHRLVQQNSENGESLTSTPSPLTPMDSANNLMEAENSCDLYQQFTNPFKAAFLNSALQSKHDQHNMAMDSSNHSSPPAPTLSAAEPLANLDVLMQTGLFNNLIGAYQQQQMLHHQQHQNQQSNNNQIVKMEQTAE